MFEGKSLDFMSTHKNERSQTGEVVSGKVICSGYVPGGGDPVQPIIMVNGKMQFSLSGEPLFFKSELGSEVLTPTFHWLL
jgi:hypothetical protein